MIKLSPNIRFSPYIAKGNMVARAKTTEEINKKVFQRMLQLYENKTACSIGVIKNSYNMVLPERKNIQILQLPQRNYGEFGASTRVEDSRGYLTGYSIELPTNKKKRFNILELSTLMHESTHVLDYLLNPKYIANYKHVCEKGIYKKKYYSLYDKYFDNPDLMSQGDKKKTLEQIEQEARRKLKKVPQDEKIIFLNFLKYSMEMEQHAYSQDVKFARMLQKLGKPVDEESLEDYTTFMAYPEKIKIISKLIKEEINNIRK